MRSRKLLSLLLTAAVLAGTICLPTASALPDHPGEIEHAGYMRGYPDGTFRPEATLSRAEGIDSLFRSLPLDQRPETFIGYRAFADVPLSSDAWYAFSLMNLSVLGIIHGYPDNTFRPDQPLTRGELMVLLHRMYPSEGTDVSAFPDVPADHWAYPAISAAVSRGWVTGYPDGTFRPDQNMTRVEAAALLGQVLNQHCDRDFLDNYDQTPSYSTFSDVPPSFWGYDVIMEASVGHFCIFEDGKEVWTRLILGA